MLWLFIFSLDVGYWQSWLQSLGALLWVTFIWRMLKHWGKNYKQQLQDIFHPKGYRKKPAQLWTMRVQLRIGANPFIKLAQISQSDRSVQCGDFWLGLVLICYLNSGFGLGSTPCSWQQARCVSPAKLSSAAGAAPWPCKAMVALLVLYPGLSRDGRYQGEVVKLQLCPQFSLFCFHPCGHWWQGRELGWAVRGSPHIRSISSLQIGS